MYKAESPKKKNEEKELGFLVNLSGHALLFFFFVSFVLSSNCSKYSIIFPSFKSRMLH